MENFPLPLGHTALVTLIPPFQLGVSLIPGLGWGNQTPPWPLPPPLSASHPSVLHGPCLGFSLSVPVLAMPSHSFSRAFQQTPPLSLPCLQNSSRSPRVGEPSSWKEERGWFIHSTLLCSHSVLGGARVAGRAPSALTELTSMVVMRGGTQTTHECSTPASGLPHPLWCPILLGL